MTTIVEYLSGVDASDTRHHRAHRQGAGAVPDDLDFASWLDLLVVMCPGPIAQACGFAPAGRTTLAHSMEERT